MFTHPWTRTPGRIATLAAATFVSGFVAIRVIAKMAPELLVK